MVKIWPISKEDLIAEDCSKMNRKLDIDEWRQDPNLRDYPYHEICACEECNRG